MKFVIIFVMFMALMPTACAQVTDFTVIEPFPETVVAGNHVNATVSFVSDSEPFDITLTVESPTLFRTDGLEIIEMYIVLDNTIINSECTLIMNCNIVQVICDDIMLSGEHTLITTVLLNPAIQPDDYTFDLTVSWQEDVAGLITATKTKSTRAYSGNHQIIEQEEPTTHFKENWSPYDDENGKGEIDLNGAGGGGYVYGNITDENDKQVEKEPFYFGQFMMLILLFIAIVLIIDYIYNYKKKKDKHEIEQKYA